MSLKKLITETHLTAAEYRRWTKAGPCHPYSDFFYQKRFSDQRGIRYFLQFVHYPEIPGGQAGGTYMAEIVITDPHMTFQIHRPASIQDAEDRAQEFWATHNCDYYELF